ncbi:hypothetical protein [Paenibacillus sp. PK3_47]|uniref:hypothetical protein n=1 Tax=Paenibacillus sp. PK3_47 TaxID=2072642 RepID=UPI00201DB81F|nr:hypothetical protein [Paenibacillus sp. PK3_47]
MATQEALKGHRYIIVDLFGAGYSDKPDDSDFKYTANRWHSMAWENPEGLAKAIENGIQTNLHT